MKKTKKNSKNKWIIFVIAVLFLTFTIGIVCLTSQNIYRQSDELPMPFGFGLSLVTSGSMTPTLQVNDIAVIVPRDQYEVGDIVVFNAGEGLTIHRIIVKNENQVTTKGDYEGNSPDTPFDVSAIQGKMIFKIPAVGSVFEFIKTPIVFVLLLSLAAFLLFKGFTTDSHGHDEAKNEGK